MLHNRGKKSSQMNWNCRVFLPVHSTELTKIVVIGAWSQLKFLHMGSVIASHSLGDDINPFMIWRSYWQNELFCFREIFSCENQMNVIEAQTAAHFFIFNMFYLHKVSFKLSNTSSLNKHKKISKTGGIFLYFFQQFVNISHVKIQKKTCWIVNKSSNLGQSTHESF